jgi:hypothetical protein
VVLPSIAEDACLAASDWLVVVVLVVAAADVPEPLTGGGVVLVVAVVPADEVMLAVPTTPGEAGIPVLMLVSVMTAGAPVAWTSCMLRDEPSTPDDTDPVPRALAAAAVLDFLRVPILQRSERREHKQKQQTLRARCERCERWRSKTPKKSSRRA